MKNLSEYKIDWKLYQIAKDKKDKHYNDMIENINNTPMTLKERTSAKKEALEYSRLYYQELIEPYDKQQEELTKIFYIDCRKHLDYEKYGIEIINMIEKYALKHAHNGELEEIYYYLVEITDLIHIIMAKIT